MSETMQGILYFHSETGTEGGYYAFQHEKFMNLPAPAHWLCQRCGYVWDKERDPETPPTVSDQETREAAVECRTNGHADFERLYPHGMWSREGLKMLNDGDHLRVFAPDNGELVWEGEVKLRAVDSYGPEGGTMGWRVHHKEDMGIGENVWFGWFQAEFPAELTPYG